MANITLIAPHNYNIPDEEHDKGVPPYHFILQDVPYVRIVPYVPLLEVQHPRYLLHLLS